MRAGRLAALFGFTTMAVTGLYFFVYLWRWEWNRALIAGLIFVAIEVAMATAMVLGQFRRLNDRLAQPDARVLSRLRESAPPVRDHFEWLEPGSASTGVFVPLLLGMGVVASALAWMVERLARHTAGPVLERGLASRLAPLAWPADGLVPRRGESEALTVLDRPAPRRR